MRPAAVARSVQGLELLNSQGLVVTGRTSSLHTARLGLLLVFSALNEHSGASPRLAQARFLRRPTAGPAHAARSRRRAPVRLAHRENGSGDNGILVNRGLTGRTAEYRLDRAGQAGTESSRSWAAGYRTKRWAQHGLHLNSAITNL